MIGIYKIISPSNKIYVGQSTDIEKRFNASKKKRFFLRGFDFFHVFINEPKITTLSW